MIVYLDLILLLNFGFDLLLLITTATILKRNVATFRIILAAVIGSLSVFLMFVPLTNITLFIYKMLISIVMLIVAFGYKNFPYFIKNFFFLYLISIFLGGVLYFLNIQLSYQNEGLIFFHRGISINWFIIIIGTPISLYFYYKQAKILKITNNNLYSITITLNNKQITTTGYLDTGNNLYDPYSHRPVILIEQSLIGEIDLPKLYVPYQALNSSSLLECIKVEELQIKDIGSFKNCLVGLSTDKFYIDDVKCILHPYYF